MRLRAAVSSVRPWQVVTQMLERLVAADCALPDRAKSLISLQLSEVDMCLVEGADDYLQARPPSPRCLPVASSSSPPASSRLQLSSLLASTCRHMATAC
jgi:hypothetical protein